HTRRCAMEIAQRELRMYVAAMSTPPSAESRPSLASPPAPDASGDLDPGTGAPPSLLRNRSYLLLMTGLTAESLGAGVALFAVPLVAYGLTGSVVQAGVVAAVGQVGGLLATLPAGVVADRVDRRRLGVAGVRRAACRVRVYICVR